MTEEQVTRFALTWLVKCKFQIIHFDYPGSGTGKGLHPNPEFRTTKNSGIIIPDVIAAREKHLTFFENKVLFSRGDIDNLLLVKSSGRYSNAVERLLAMQQNGCTPYIGAALENTEANKDKLLGVRDEIDFAVLVSSNGEVDVLYAPPLLFR